MTAVARHSAVAGVESIRAQFPAMRRTHGGHPVAYLDGPGGTQVPASVVERMSEYLYHHNANTHWRYPTSEETDELIAGSRATVAEFLNGAADEIAFGANMTSLTFHLARAIGREWTSDDEIIVTELDHHANVAPWTTLQRERGVRIQKVRMDAERGTLDMADLERRLGERTRLVAIGAASNALGTVTDVKRVAALARNAKALCFVDAVHLAPHELIDVRDIGCDFLACSAYKFYGPHIGILWGRRELLERIDVPKLDPAPDEAPERMETGTQNHEGIVGAAAAVDFLADLTKGAGARRERLAATLAGLHDRGAALFRNLWDGLGEVGEVRRYGLEPGARRTPTLSFRIEGVASDEVAAKLAQRGLFVSHGDFYAATVIERLNVGPDGVVRIGCSAYTTREEVERVVRAVEMVSRET